MTADASEPQATADSESLGRSANGRPVHVKARLRSSFRYCIGVVDGPASQACSLRVKPGGRGQRPAAARRATTQTGGLDPKGSFRIRVHARSTRPSPARLGQQSERLRDAPTLVRPSRVGGKAQSVQGQSEKVRRGGVCDSVENGRWKWWEAGRKQWRWWTAGVEFRRRGAPGPRTAPPGPSLSLSRQANVTIVADSDLTQMIRDSPSVGPSLPQAQPVQHCVVAPLAPSGGGGGAATAAVAGDFRGAEAEGGLMAEAR